MPAAAMVWACALLAATLLGEEAPVEGEAALPLLEGAVEGFAEAAGPHFCGLLVFCHRFNSFVASGAHGFSSSPGRSERKSRR